MNIVKKVIEDEAFWQNHDRLKKSSGLSRKSYCKQHNSVRVKSSKPKELNLEPVNYYDQ